MRHLLSQITSLRASSSRREIVTGCAILLLAAVTLTGCTPTSLAPPAGPPEAVAANRAEALSARGLHQDAADAYLELARGAERPVVRQRFLILMARERLLAGFPEVAETILSRLGDPIDAGNLLLWTTVRAGVDIAMGEPQQALAVLERAPPATDPDLALEILRLKGNALFRTGRPVAATNVLIERETWLDERDAILAHQSELWASYQAWGGALPPAGTDEDADPILAGWLELGRIAWTQRTSPMTMRSALRAWQAGRFTHPANDTLVPAILDRLPAAIDYPARVAVLLPLSGAQKQTARAVRDGLLAAHFRSDTGSVRPQITFYDTDASDTTRAYGQAVSDGAEFIIGPLLKRQVEELALIGISTPTLTLNFLPEDSPLSVGFYQFSLSPEDEARQVARRAAALGQHRALALAPNNSWGRRMLDSFTGELQALGGFLLDYQFYDPGNPDFSGNIERLLLINESRARRDRLSANMGVKFEYEPRRRSDIDLIFLAARAETGKLIRPQLRFHYAGNVPTYSTSAIWQEGSRNNSDLNGIMFPDTPWVIAPDGLSVELRETLQRYWPEQAERRSRLYALGFDAYRLIPIVNAGNYRGEIEGVTGTLYLDDRNRVLRRLPWAKIQRGRPVLMNSIAEQIPPTSRNRSHSQNLSQSRNESPKPWHNTTTTAGSPKQ